MNQTKTAFREFGKLKIGGRRLHSTLFWGQSHPSENQNLECFNFGIGGRSSFYIRIRLRNESKMPRFRNLKKRPRKKAREFLDMQRKQTGVPDPGRKKYHLPHSDEEQFQYYEERGESRPDPNGLTVSIGKDSWKLLEKMDMGDNSGPTRKSISKWRKIALDGWADAP